MHYTIKRYIAEKVMYASGNYLQMFIDSHANFDVFLFFNFMTT